MSIRNMWFSYICTIPNDKIIIQIIIVIDSLYILDSLYIIYIYFSMTRFQLLIYFFSINPLFQFCYDEISKLILKSL